MKVIEGNFNKPPEGPDHAGERLKHQLEGADLFSIEKGNYVLLFDAPDSICIITNGDGVGDVLLTLEKGKSAIMSSLFHAEVAGGGDTA